ncbi:MAG: glycosyltransferase family 2 protein [bacterium]
MEEPNKQKFKSKPSVPNENPKDESAPKPNKRFFYRNRKYYKSYSTPRESVKKSSFQKVSVLIPLLNEEGSIQPLYKEIKKAFQTLSVDHEILFIDDGSTDNSLYTIRGLCNLDKKVRFISFRKNYGKSAALHVGFKHVTGDAIITMDADLQDDPAEILNLLKKLEEGYDLVSGWKKKRHDPFVKRISSKFFNYVTRVLSGIKIHDFNCGLKAYRKEVVSNLEVYGELHRYIPVLADWKGFKVTEIPVLHHPRRYGKTKFGISRFFKGFIDLITVMFTTRYIKRPMHLFGFIGAFAVLAGIIVNAYLTFEWIFYHKALSNRPLLFLGILLIIVGIQFFSIGLLGEIMVHSARSETDYVIREKR